ncbi:Glycogen synthase [Allorhodopirellula heiligendammensis]|uniref:Glycogen synthase n=1 Tax=Allorhodopirellula heiligendammensis TaxID=2714739 RepID=A0A5C6C611_9BACT|nr:Glycogen synthase [Allorhodopirellula heiligendammensis]
MPLRGIRTTSNLDLPTLGIELNIVYLTTEAVPFAKTGGLADVCGKLPSVVADAGHQCAVIMPAFDSIRRSQMTIEQTEMSFAIEMPGDRIVGGRVLRSYLPGGMVPVYFVDQPQYFSRPFLYGDKHGDYRDNAERFIFFCRAAIEVMKRMDRPVDLIQCNDWQTALVPALVQNDGHGFPRDTPTVLSIHNLAYQGSFPAESFEATGLPWDRFRSDSFEYYGGMNFLKTGIVTADQVCTVSPTYAEEIKTPLHGCGLDPILRSLGDRVSGIINGIDTDIWNPAKDVNLVRNYDVTNWEHGKLENKLALQAELGLPSNPDVPMIGLVGRLADQKGWDLILPVMREHLRERRPTQWAVLGSGDPVIESELTWLASEHPDQLAAYVGFSDPLAHRIEASSDLFVMPSRYEPCGLNQLYSLRYGTICVVTETGGLADTIINTTRETVENETATGFHLRGHDAASLDRAIGDALRLRFHEKEIWKKIVERGMTRDWSWGASALQYIELYEKTISLKQNGKMRV